MSKKFTAHAIAIAVSAAIGAVPAYAAESDANEAKSVEKIVIVGSRAAPRSVSESPVPVDVIGGEEFMNQGNTDMLSTLSSSVPSFNVNAQPISDAATLVRPANLRGLPPDSTLVLVNGKRRHRSAVIAFLGGGISDGSQGPDISVIPGIALKQVEVLRDGAAAQYGSDAIAGVINFVLKDDSEGGMFEARWGETFDGDGGSNQYSGNIGLPFTDNGFANLSFELKDARPTDRSVQRADAAGLNQNGYSIPNPAQVWGSPEVRGDFKLFANIGLELDANKEFYMFGNWAQRKVDGGFFFRNPETRGGVFASGGNPLIGDLTPDDGIACEQSHQAAMNDPNCWSFQEMFPNGFTPRFGGIVTDAAIAGGVKGELENGMLFDVSASVGRNEAEFSIRNTLNPSLGPDSPTSFSPGKYVEIEKQVNIDVTQFYDVGFEDPISVSGGFELREETFEIYAGDAKSFEVGPLASQGFGIGSNGFPGFKPEDAGSFDRISYGLYVDVEGQVTEQLLLGTAIRYEHFDDFGDTLNGKFTFQYQATDEFGLRGSASTGFRAPTVGQSNVRNVTTAFGPNGLEDQATLPPTNPIAIQKGATPLQPEESVSFTFGAVAEINDFYITMDYFNIEVTDRISQTSTLALTAEDIQALIDLGIQDASSFSSVKYFTNDFDTTTQGIDFVANYAMDMFGGETTFGLAMNWTDTTVDSFNPDIIDATKVRQLEENLPNTRGSLTANHTNGDWRVLLRVNHFGSFYEAHLDDGSLPIEVGSEFTVDAEVAYDVNDNVRLIAGAQNIFNTYPEENPWSAIAGAKYPVTSPFGFNGGFYYLRAQYIF